MSIFKVLIVAVILLECAVSSGCGPTDKEPQSSSSQSASTDAGAGQNDAQAITVIGDDTASDVAATLEKRGLSVSSGPATVQSARIVVVAVDATAGVRDGHRQLVQDLGKNRNAQVIWLFTKMSQIDDRELMDLQQSEAQELLEQSGVPSSRVRFAVDTDQTTVNSDTLKGWADIEKHLSN